MNRDEGESRANPWVETDPWSGLREYTDARLALGHAGVSIPTEAQLSFQAAHALARDAVHCPLDCLALRDGLVRIPTLPHKNRLFLGQSAAESRDQYLRRPDLGRRLSEESLDGLRGLGLAYPGGFDLALVLGDGLSARAIQTNAIPFLAEFLALMGGWAIAPVCVIRQARVAVGDEVAHALGARALAVLIGERPGLSSPDSMGIYLTWDPRPGQTRDDARNCISNVRPQGLSYPLAASKLAYLLHKARSLGYSGLRLKDDQPSLGSAETMALT